MLERFPMLEQCAEVKCAFCSSSEVEKISSFGTAQLVRQYYCNNCRCVFEYIRWQGDQTKE